MHDCKKFCWGTKWVPAELVVGGDQLFVRGLVGVSISRMAASIYNMGVWEKVAAAWLKAGVCRTLEGEAVARRRYQDTGLSLENGGWVEDPHVVVEQCWVFPCILHCCMAMGRLQVTFIEARLGVLPKDNAVAVQRALYRARTGVMLGASASADGEEARAFFLACKELRPLLAYAPEDDEWQAVVAMRDLLQDLYSNTPPRTDLPAAEVARVCRLHSCKAACQSNFLFYLKEDVTLVVANAARLGVGLGAVCANVVESLNAILKRAYNNHTARGGGDAGGYGTRMGGGGGFASVGVVVFQI